jgi:hypothetical protein
MRTLPSSSSATRGFLGLLGTPANSRKPTRPSLKVVRHEESAAPIHFTFEVWSPFVGAYQPVASIEDGLRRVDELASLIGRMWIQKHPKQHALTDAPDLGVINCTEWAELRANATPYRSYDTRRSDRPTWVRATGLAQATDMICKRAGYERPKATLA